LAGDTLLPRTVGDVAIIGSAARSIEGARLRPADVPVVRADVSKMRDAFGWETRIPLGLSLADMWSEAVAGGGRPVEGA
jgi:GDP-D-mannose dehydratase